MFRMQAAPPLMTDAPDRPILRRPAAVTLAARLGWVLWGLALVAAIAAFVVRFETWARLEAGVSGAPLLAEILLWGLLIPAAAPAYATVGALVASRMPRNPIGWMCLALGLSISLQDLTWQYAAHAVLDAPGTLPGGIPAGLAAVVANRLIHPLQFTLILLLFPTGRLPGRSWMGVAALALVGGAVAALAAALQPTVEIGVGVMRPNPLGVAGLAPWIAPANAAARMCGQTALLLAGASLAVRWRRAEGERRRQLTLLVAIVGIAMVGMLGAETSTWTFGPEAYAAVLASAAAYAGLSIGVPLAICIAMLKYRLYDVETLVSRALVYGSVAVASLGIYIALVGGSAAILSGAGRSAAALLATGVIAVLFQPLRAFFQRRIGQLLYGDRDRPSVALTRLGQRLEAAIAPETVLPTIVSTVRDALRLPYAAIILDQDGAGIIAAAAGAPTALPEFLPLVNQGEVIGYLAVESCSGERGFSPRDRQLLTDLARQAGVAAAGVRLTAELQRARERLIATREEERRRLRRDLHDGLGPQLASQTLTLDAARRLLRHDPDAAEALLADAIAHAQAAVADVRRLVYGLRPPALDDLGLVGALQEQAARYRASGLDVTVVAPEHIPSLPAAVEVAAYRIAQEALANVVRHADARACTVALHVAAGQLALDVHDDGRGLAPGARAGVGLGSMRERAAELGGRCTVEDALGGGTIVRVRLPCGPMTTA
jgi:signal transduction histidine kinase